nr:hypothetical protein [uncultured Flavobacterium sp.]
MYFTEKELETMQTIFRRLEGTTLNSLQYFIKENEFRTGCTLAIFNKWKKPICIFQNFEFLSPFRMKLLMKLSDKIPHRLHITYPREDITRIGWKIESLDKNILRSVKKTSN